MTLTKIYSIRKLSQALAAYSVAFVYSSKDWKPAHWNQEKLIFLSFRKLGKWAVI